MAVGYSGFAQILDGGNTITLLTTGMSINPELNPINSASAVGYGWKNAADVSHFANGVRDYRGSLDFDMQGATVWNVINEWAITERVYPKQFRHSPDGTRIYEYGYGTDAGDWADKSKTTQHGAWCESFRLNTSQDSSVQASLGVLALRRSEQSATGDGYFDNELGKIAGSCGESSGFGTTMPLNPQFDNLSPIPFWKTNARLYKGASEHPAYADTETVMWGVDLNNSPQIIKTCNGEEEDGYGVASAVVMGPMSVSGNIQIFKHGGVPDPVANPIYAHESSFVISIMVGTGSSLICKLPAVKVESDSYDHNLTGPVFRTFSLKGLGGKCVGGAVSAPIIMTTGSAVSGMGSTSDQDNDI